MKPNILIKLLIFLIITSVSVFAASKGVSPSSVTAGNTVRIYLNGDKTLPSEYDIRFSVNSSGVVQMHNNQHQYWYYNLSTKSGYEGTYTVHYYLYKNGTQYGDLGTSSFTVNAPKPTFNSGVAIYDTSGGFSLRWNSASGGVSRYELYRSTSNGSLGSRIYSGSATSHTDTGLSNGVTYYYTAKACNSSGCTQGTQDYKRYSAPKPTFNSGVAIYDTSGGFSLRWNSASGGVSRYELYRSTSNGSLGSRIYSGSATSHTDTGLSNGVTYYYTAKACNSSGCTQGTQDYKRYSKPIPTITSTSIDKTTGYSGDSFTFRANLSSSLPSGYNLYVNFGSSNGWLSQNQAGGHAKMDNHGSYWNLSTVINSTSTNKFRIGIFDSNDRLVGSYSSAKYFTVKQKQETQYPPSVSIQSADSSVNQDSTYQITLNFTDKNNDLKNAFVNWGDGTTNSSVELSGGNSTKTFTHIFNKAGNFTWKVVVHDHRDVATSVQKMVTVSEKSISDTAILNLLNKDSLIQKMNLSAHLSNPISRSDAVVLVDRMRALVKNGIDKNMQEYYNPFADVPEDAEYLPSLMRLAYYRSKSFDGNPINKYNSLFNPMRQMTREEFLAVALTSFDIPKKDADLSKFTDTTDMSDWAIKYFKTAVYYGIINGNNNRLLAKDPISIQEALWILEGIKEKFGANYPFYINSYDIPESLDVSQVLNKEIGFEYEPKYYKNDATPIDISKIGATKKDNYYILTVNSTIDTNNGASDYYWWSANKGYFKEVPSNGNYKTVYFYPMSSKPETDYHITVHGGDNLGYVGSATLIISKDNFAYPEDLKAKNVLNVVSAQFANVQIDNSLIANKIFTIDLSNVEVKKSNLELGIDQVVVIMVYKDDNGNDRTYELFHGTPSDKKARFIVGDYRELYGKSVTLRVTLYSQAKKYTTSKTLTYAPMFTIKGKVYNAIGGTKVSSVLIGGKNIPLDENGEFYYHIDSTQEVKQLEIKTKENSEQNHFNPIKIDLTYDSPSRYVVLVGKDIRPSLNLTISPIRVPSNKSVKFTLTSDTVIPPNAKIELDGSSCAGPKGMGTKKVETTCTTASTDSIKYALMTINSAALYGGGLSRTIIIDNDANADTNTTDSTKTLTLDPITNLSIAEDTSGSNVTLNANDTAGNPITYTATSSDPSIATVSIVDGHLIVTPVANASGVVNIEVNATANGQSATQSFQVNIAPVNDAPYIDSNLSNLTVKEDSPSFSVDMNVSDVEGDALNVSVTTNNSKLVRITPNWKGLLNQAQYSGSTLNFNLTLSKDAYGSATIEVNVDDGTALSTKTFDLTVIPVNDAPKLSAVADRIYYKNFEDKSITLKTSDVDNTNFTYTAKALTKDVIGAINIVGNTMIIQSLNDVYGDTNVSIMVSDGDLTDSKTFHIHVLSFESGTTQEETGPTEITENNESITYETPIGKDVKIVRIEDKNGTVEHKIEVGNTSVVEAVSDIVGSQVETTSEGVRIRYDDMNVKAEADANVIGEARHTLIINGQMIRAVSEVPGAKTRITRDNEGLIEISTTLRTSKENISVIAKEDGTVKHILHSQGQDSTFSASIAGAKTNINSDGVTTQVDIPATDSEEIRAVTTTKNDGSTTTRFEKIGSNGGILKTFNTFDPSTPLPAGNSVDIELINGQTYLKIETPVTTDIKVK